MRHRWLAALAALVPTLASGQTVLEARFGALTEYRFVDLSHTFAKGPVLDLLYTGVPGANEFYFGAGWQLRGKGVTFTPIVYGVVGKENDERGITLGALWTFDRGGFKSVGFAGRFFRTSGGVDDYDFADAIDVTRVIGRFELGLSTGFFHPKGGAWAWLVGPTVKLNDKRGNWALSLRGGDDEEIRFLRVLVF